MVKFSLDSELSTVTHDSCRFMLFVYDDYQSSGGMADYFSGFDDLEGFKDSLMDMLDYNNYDLLSRTGSDNYQIFDRLKCVEVSFSRSIFSKFKDLDSFCSCVFEKLIIL